MIKLLIALVAIVNSDVIHYHYHGQEAPEHLIDLGKQEAPSTTHEEVPSGPSRNLEEFEDLNNQHLEEL